MVNAISEHDKELLELILKRLEARDEKLSKAPDSPILSEPLTEEEKKIILKNAVDYTKKNYNRTDSILSHLFDTAKLICVADNDESRAAYDEYDELTRSYIGGDNFLSYMNKFILSKQPKKIIHVYRIKECITKKRLSRV